MTMRTYSMTHGFTAEDGSEISCDIIYSVSGDPRDAEPEIEIESIGIDDDDLRRSMILVDHLFDQAAELKAELLAHANERERTAREYADDMRTEAYRKR